MGARPHGAGRGGGAAVTPLPAPPKGTLTAVAAKYAVGLAPFVIVWLVLVGWLVSILNSRAEWSETADEALVKEWLEEVRPFRKTLPELVREYLDWTDHAAEWNFTAKELKGKRDEIAEQMRATAEPTRAYDSKLPGFPVIYRLSVRVTGASGAAEEIAWDNPQPRPRQQNQTRVRAVAFDPSDKRTGRAEVRCEYQMHAFNRLESQERERRRESLIAGAVLVAATLLAAVFVSRFLNREVRRETEKLRTAAAAEHRERELLETRIAQQQAERDKEELDRKLLRQQLDAATLEKRADQAEKTALEMKSQLYASIGIMAGSYAHNIKNLLVRPNDLLNRCLETTALPPDQAGMLSEVQHTLGTVTERLQQILRTVRRDPSKSDLTRVDLSALARDTAATWGDIGRDKWKVTVVSDAPSEPLWVEGDFSHLQQAIENLVFNARDATFEMRNYLREEARRGPAEDRKKKLLEAAGWKGEIVVSVRPDNGGVLLEVRDNGIGMTAEVKANCLTTHFSTKRDNALFAGFSAGMGLGLSFVAVVLEHHRTELTIDTAPLKGATFRVWFPPPAQSEPEA
jgi:signal transduction histidine kinase